MSVCAVFVCGRQGVCVCVWPVVSPTLQVCLCMVVWCGVVHAA